MRSTVRRLLCRPRATAAAIVPIANPKFAIVGASNSQFGNQGISLDTRTLTRDTNGLVTVALTNHGIFGSPKINIVNCSDTSYQGMYDKITVDANSFSYQTSTTGQSGSIVGTSLTQAVIQNRFTNVGYWTWLQSDMGGGGQLVGNFAQGGDQNNAMTEAIAQACASDADIVIYVPDVNDVNAGGQDGPTTLARITANVNTLLAANKKVALVSITPLGAAVATTGKNTATLYANAGMAALANGTTVVYADVHQDLVDTGATQFTDGRAWTWVTSDNVHIGGRAAKLGGGRLYAAIDPWITTVNCLPTASGNLPTIPGYTAIYERGPWSNVGGGTQGTGSTGTLQPKQTCLSSNSRTTIVNSLVDRGNAALGYYQHQVITPGGADIVTNYWHTNSGVTIGSLGLTTSDTVLFVAEISVTGSIAANMSMMNLVIQSNSSGAFGLASCGDAIALASSAYRSDDLTDVILMTGPLQLNASVTHLLTKLETRYTAAGTAHTMREARVALYKKNP